MRILSIVLAVGSVFSVAAAQPYRLVKDQFRFDTTSALAEPVATPPNVVQAILVSMGMKELTEGKCGNEFKNCLRSGRIRLAKSGAEALLVIGSFPLTGADNDWFWIVRFVNNRPELLFIGCNEVKLRESYSKGLRDIETVLYLSPSTNFRTYKFDGHQYRLTRNRWIDKR